MQYDYGFKELKMGSRELDGYPNKARVQVTPSRKSYFIKAGFKKWYVSKEPYFFII